MYIHLYIADILKPDQSDESNNVEEDLPKISERITITVIEDEEEEKFVINKIIYCSDECLNESIDDIRKKLPNSANTNEYVIVMDDNKNTILIRENEIKYKNCIIENVNESDHVEEQTVYCQHIGEKLENLKKYINIKARVEKEIERLLQVTDGKFFASDIESSLDDRLKQLININKKCVDFLYNNKEEMIILDRFIGDKK